MKTDSFSIRYSDFGSKSSVTFFSLLDEAQRATSEMRSDDLQTEFLCQLLHDGITNPTSNNEWKKFVRIFHFTHIFGCIATLLRLVSDGSPMMCSEESNAVEFRCAYQRLSLTKKCLEPNGKFWGLLITHQKIIQHK